MGKKGKGRKRGRKTQPKKAPPVVDDWDEEPSVEVVPEPEEEIQEELEELVEEEDIPEAVELEEDPEEEIVVSPGKGGRRRRGKAGSEDGEKEEKPRPGRSGKKGKVPTVIEEEPAPETEKPKKKGKRGKKAVEVIEEPEEEPQVDDIDDLSLDEELMSSLEDVSDIVDGLEEQIAQQEDSHALKRDAPGVTDVIGQAWEDGVITSDEMALLHVLRKRFKVDEETFKAILEESRPEGGHILDGTEEDSSVEPDDGPDENDEIVVAVDDSSDLPDDDLEELDVEDDDESGDSSDLQSGDFEDDIESEDSSNLQGGDLEDEFDVEDSDSPVDDFEVEEDDDDLPDIDETDESENSSNLQSGDLEDDYDDDWDDDDMDLLEEEILKEEIIEPPQRMPEIPGPPPPPPPASSMITLTSSVRGTAPLGASFDLKQRTEGPEATKRSRCTKCKNLISIRPDTTKCPICSTTISPKEEVSSHVRSLIDQARGAIKGGEHARARHLLRKVLLESPGNKEALFFMRKVKASLTKGGPEGGKGTQVDLRNIANISTGVSRLDLLTNGGLPVGSQIMLKGPPFCGKEVLFDQIVASALKAGFPVIYVSTNRAMKDVIQGIVRYVPDFKAHNREGRIRMYDLFSKHDTKMVLKEGHRIFNLEIKEDFKKFREDLIFVQEDAVKMYGGGLMIINSLSPLISQTDINDLLKFLQMLIVRSKGFRFTNLVDVAHGIHDESVINSVEYLMEGIIEFKEKDSRNQLRLRGFGQKVASREWIDYNLTPEGLNLHGSFTEQRIV